MFVEDNDFAGVIWDNRYKVVATDGIWMYDYLTKGLYKQNMNTIPYTD